MQAVVYPEKLQKQVDEFDALPAEEKNAQYWDKTNKELKELKEFIKNHYLLDQEFTCVYCRQRIEVKHHGAWDAEHIVAKDSHPQFMFIPENLCIACKDCNGDKKAKNVLNNPERSTFPKNKLDYIIAHPHFDIYSDEIKIIEPAGFYLPKGEKGRKTIEICGLLRFLYKFADYKCVSEEITRRISFLARELEKAKNGMEQAAIMCAIRELTTEGIKLQSQKIIDGIAIPAKTTQM